VRKITALDSATLALHMPLTRKLPVLEHRGVRFAHATQAELV
jgi:hypothetical protein